MITFGEYMSFFDRWINYQFPRGEDAAQNALILQTVGQIVLDDDDREYWAARDNWSMFYHARDEAKARA
jgi:hypothetical protein